MAFCTECGNSYLDEAKYCPHCGEPNKLLSKSETPVPANVSNLRQQTDVSGGGSYGLNINDLPAGTTLENGRYTILKKLGQGGFGVVYKASDANYNGVNKALKVIYSENYSDRLVMHKLKAEATNMIQVNHPNVVRLYDVHFDGEIKFLDMEYIDGGDLVDLMLKSPDNKIPEAKVWELASQISVGMQAIHQIRLLHLDLKPENVLLTKSGKAKITDFGISETFRSSKSRIAESDVKGTFVYASPEQLIGKNVGKETDVWSFGATLYHILTGETLYSGVTSSDVIIQIERRKFESLLKVSKKMNNLLTKCLQKEYSERFRNFDEVLEYVNGKVTFATKTTPDISEEANDENKVKLKIKDDFVFVEGGSFQMGSDSGFRIEGPAHKVTLSSFYLAKHQVTQAEWQEVMKNNPSRFQQGKRVYSLFGFGKRILNETSNHPVETITWEKAVEFCKKKSKKEGLEPVYSGSGKNIQCDFAKNGYRLPTEAEWEYAARGGKRSQGYLYSGSDYIDEVAEYSKINNKSTKPVGESKSNELGLYDMSGNVQEWCWDKYKQYSGEAEVNPVGPAKGSRYVCRGGSFWSNAIHCTTTSRCFNYPLDSQCDIGFRLARSADKDSE